MLDLANLRLPVGERRKAASCETGKIACDGRKRTKNSLPVGQRRKVVCVALKIACDGRKTKKNLPERQRKKKNSLPVGQRRKVVCVTKKLAVI